MPQDDIIHRGLPLRRTLRYAARLRLPADSAPGEVDRVVDETLDDLELADRRDVLVGDLSGGQRKRASIAVELLTSPRVFFLDEPTSGLDPATSAEVLSVLRRLADRGVTVVLTTHDPANIDACDRVVFLARSRSPGVLGSTRTMRAATSRSPTSRTSTGASPTRALPDTGQRASPAEPSPPAPPQSMANAPVRPHPVVGPLRQSALLTLRNADLLVRSRLTLAVLVGSPVLVISMMAVLFKARRLRSSRAPGSLGPGTDDLLGRVRRILLRPHLRPAPDRRRVLGVPPRTLGGAECRRLPRLQDRSAAPAPGWR